MLRLLLRICGFGSPSVSREWITDQRRHEWTRGVDLPRWRTPKERRVLRFLAAKQQAEERKRA